MFVASSGRRRASSISLLGALRASIRSRYRSSVRDSRRGDDRPADVAACDIIGLDIDQPGCPEVAAEAPAIARVPAAGDQRVTAHRPGALPGQMGGR